MTRSDEIRKAAYDSTKSDEDYLGFLKGAQWADEHPKEKKISIDNNSKNIKNKITMNETLIKHKLNVGDTAWIMFDNMPCEETVITVNSVTDEKGTRVFYTTAGFDTYRSFNEGKIFPTKDELLDSLR